MRTAFHELHRNLGAKMIDFHGWEMPLQYSGIIDEHITTRSHVGIFDVSHMGRFEIKGDGSSDLLQSLLTNDVAQLHDYKALYSPMCNQEGGIIDDLIVYRKGKNEYILVVNASNRRKDYAWISSHLTSNVEIHDTTFSTSLIAVQGPSANDLMCKLINGTDVSELKSFDMVDTNISGIKCMVSRTGYTGEDGFEIMFDSPVTKVWDALLEAGKEYHIKPCGLGSRDSLRLEAGLLLHGIDMDENTTPLEVPLKWTVKFEKGDFIGKQTLLHKKVQRKLVGFEVLESKRIARHKNEVFLHQQNHDHICNKIGTVTSGGFSPILHKSIGFCFVPSYIAREPQTGIISIDIGGKSYKGRIVESYRFYRRSY
ncbi:MAG: glycine cleavage system aminomethyltransferase GcvT [Nitrososphaeraceae archaeon]